MTLRAILSVCLTALVGLIAIGAGAAAAIPTSQKQFRLVRAGEHGYQLQQADAPVRCRVRMR
jgi:hypothetical protein